MNEITLTEVVALIGGVVLAARILVKLTPTPKDDTVLDKVVKVLKQLGLYIPLVCLCFLNLSCTVTFDPVSRTPSVTTDPETVEAITNEVTRRVNESLINATK